MSRLPVLTLAIAIAACLSAKADIIDHLTLTTSAFGSTNITKFTYVKGQGPTGGFLPVTIDSDPASTGTVAFTGASLVLNIYTGGQQQFMYVAATTQVGTATQVDDDGDVVFTFTPGSYTLSNPIVYLTAANFLALDSATLDITQDAPAISPIHPVAPPPVAVAVTPEPPTITLLGTGLLGVVA